LLATHTCTVWLTCFPAFVGAPDVISRLMSIHLLLENMHTIHLNVQNPWHLIWVYNWKIFLKPLTGFMDFDQTIQKCFVCGPLPKLFKWFWLVAPKGHWVRKDQGFPTYYNILLNLWHTPWISGYYFAKINHNVRQT